MSIVALCMFGCSASDDELQVENEVANEMSTFDFDRVPFMLQGENGISNKTSSKSDNNGNGVYIVPFYSDSGRWYAEFPIYDQDQNLTHVLVVDFPPNGEDRALVFSETEMMVNFTSHGPRMFLFELGVGVTYANWCEDRDGIYKARAKTEYIPVDQNNDGKVDFYWWGPYTNPPTEMDKNFIFHIKSTLYPTFGHPCLTDLTESIDFSYTYQSANGKIRQTSSIH